MLRAAACFRREGIEVVAAPSRFRYLSAIVDDWIPGWRAVKGNEIHSTKSSDCFGTVYADGSESAATGESTLAAVEPAQSVAGIDDERGPLHDRPIVHLGMIGDDHGGVGLLHGLQCIGRGQNLVFDTDRRHVRDR